jgi:hypothetical protein
MKQRGKRSSAELAIQPAALSNRSLPPPKEMNEREKAVWKDIVGSVGADWFSRESHIMLQTLCSIQTSLSDVRMALREFDSGLPHDREGFKRYKELAGLRGRLAMQLCSLQTKLRLTISSRKDSDLAREQARRHAARPVLAPWNDNVPLQPRKNGGH